MKARKQFLADSLTYIDLLKMLYKLFKLAKKDGLIAIEAHIEKLKRVQF